MTERMGRVTGGRFSGKLRHPPRVTSVRGFRQFDKRQCRAIDRAALLFDSLMTSDAHLELAFRLRVNRAAANATTVAVPRVLL